MPAKGYQLTGKQIRDIRQTIRTVRGMPMGGSENPKYYSGQQPLEFILGEALAEPDDPRDGWTTARAYVYGTNSDGDLEYLSRQVVIVNRHIGVTGDEGQYGTALWIGGRWLAQTLSCDPISPWTAPDALSIPAEPGPGDN